MLFRCWLCWQVQLGCIRGPANGGFAKWIHHLDTKFPIIWVSKLYPDIALSSIKSEYIALSIAMCDVISLLNLFAEEGELLPIRTTSPSIKCKVFEDNQSCTRIAKALVLTPRTKHIVIRYHHFQSIVANGKIEIEHCSTLKIMVDFLMKPLLHESFKKYWKKMLGWWGYRNLELWSKQFF